MRNHNPLRPYKAQFGLGLIFFIVILIGLGVKECVGQTFDCKVSAAGGMTIKLESIITVSDSTVTFSQIDNGNLSMVKYQREKSTSGLYFTDGVITNQLVIIPYEGKIKGFAYNHQLTMFSNVKAGNGTAMVHYCWRKP